MPRDDEKSPRGICFKFNSCTDFAVMIHGWRFVDKITAVGNFRLVFAAEIRVVVRLAHNYVVQAAGFVGLGVLFLL